MQSAEGLPDRQAAEAGRSRSDWKYALNLELPDPGFDHPVRCEFRARLISGSAEQWRLATFRHVCRERKRLKGRGRQRTASTHGLAAIRGLTRLACMGEPLRHALNSLAVGAGPLSSGVGRPLWPTRRELPLPSAQTRTRGGSGTKRA